MKLCLKHYFFLFLFITLSSITVAQTNSDAQERLLYFNQDNFMIEFEKQTAEFIDDNNYLTIDKAEAQLSQVDGKIIKIKQVKPGEENLSNRQIHHKLKKSTVVFGVSYDCGQCDITHIKPTSGYIISEDGLCVTNYHVIESFIKDKEHNISMQVKLANGNAYPVIEIVSASENSDLAVVKVDTKGDKLVPLAFGDVALPGDDIYILSNPFNMIFYFTKGIVARNYLLDAYRKGENATPEMEITADFAIGSSGAPIVDQKGNLVSTVSSTRSIYYNMREQKDLQMVVKGTKPIVLLKELVEF